MSEKIPSTDPASRDISTMASPPDAPGTGPLVPAGPAASRVAAPPPVTLPPQLAERYTLMGTLGRGGMGIVLLVKDRRLHREVALKLLRFEEPRMAKLFEREARTLAGLEHDNVVRLYEFGEVPDAPEAPGTAGAEGAAGAPNAAAAAGAQGTAGAAGAPGAAGTPGAAGAPAQRMRQYLVMEYVRGNSLAERLAKGRPTLVEAVRTAIDVLRGIGEAHRSSIVHRDLKPGNVFLDSAGRAKVADFGLALVMQPGAHASAGGLAGTPGYMSPEQARREPVGAPSDVYSTGLLLHEMLTGRRVFVGDTQDEILAAQRDTVPPAPSRVNPAVPAALDDLVARALSPRPEDRPDASTLRKSLEAWLDRVERSVRPAGTARPPHPYKLLEHYETSDAPIYFGRDAETLELVELVEEPELRLIMVFGPCGIGKSSLLHAGLLPALDPARFNPVVIRASAHPALAVRAALVDLAARAAAGDTGAEPVTPADLEADPRRMDALLLALERATGRALVVVIDQAEELFTLNPVGSGRITDLFKLVETLSAGPARRTRMILSFRTEFRGAFFPLEERLGTRQRPYAVRELGRAGLVDAVEGPSRDEGYRFVYDRGLAEKIATDVARTAAETGDAAPPLLQIVCRQLHDHMLAHLGRVITSDTYRTTIGGARGALARYVEQRLASPDYRHRGTMARQMLKSLTLREEGGERYARTRDEDEVLAFPDREGARHTLERLLTDHLVIRETGEDGRHRIRLVSEVVCPLVDAWQLEPDDAERAARALGRGFARWRENGKLDEDLLAGPTLDLVAGKLVLLLGSTDAERAYVEASQAHRRSRIRRAVTAAVAVCGVVVALVWTAFFRPGEVRMNSDPAGATVSDANGTLGVTPLSTPMRPGLHTLRLTHPRYDPAEIQVRIPSGGSAEYHPVLRYPFGLFALSSDPQGATATLHRLGATAGAVPVMPPSRTPITTEVPVGTYRLELRMHGYAPLDVDHVTIESNRRLTQASPKLTRIVGRLAVQSPFAGTQARVIARDTGESFGPFPLPLASREIPAGPYRIEASGPTSLTGTVDVTLTHGSKLEVTAWAPFVRPLWESKIKGEVFAAPALADLDGDGTLDVAVAEKNEMVALSGRDGKRLWTMATGDAIWSSPAVVDLDGDGGADLAFGSNDGALHALSGRTGSELWKHDVGAGVISSPCVVPTTAGAPALVVGADDGTVTALAAATGAVIWQVKTGGKVRSSPALADLDGDGKPEVVVGSADGELRALDATRGKSLWSYRAGGEINGSPAVADLDGDGRVDVVVGARDRRVYAVTSAGKLLWTAETGDEVRSSPAVADLDGDGKPEVAVGSFDHKLYVLDGRTGKLRWARGLGDPIVSSPVIHDVDGDGSPEIVIGGRDGILHALAGATGAPIFQLHLPGPMAGAVGLGDLDRDGVRDMVVACWYDRVMAVRGRTPRPAWAAQVSPLGTNVQAGPMLRDMDADGIEDAVIGSTGGQLTAISGLTGVPLWSAEAGGAVGCVPIIADIDTNGVPDVLVTRAEGGVAAFSGRDGQRLWEKPTGRQFRATPRVFPRGGRRLGVVVGDLDGMVRAWTGNNGTQLWEHRGPGPVAYSAAMAQVDPERGLDVVVAYGGGQVQALATANGTVTWTARLGADALAAPEPCDPDLDGKADLALLTGDAKIIVLRAADGSLRWSHAVPGGSALPPLSLPLRAGMPAAFVVGTRQGHVIALQMGKEQPLWDVALPSEITALGRAHLDRKQLAEVLAITGDGRLTVLSGEDGHPLTSFDLVAGTAAEPMVETLGPERRRCLLAVHLGCALVATPLARPLVAMRAPQVFSFTSGSGRWAEPTPGR